MPYEPMHVAYLKDLDAYRPLHGRCILQLHRQDPISPSGLIIPEVARDLKIDNKSAFATVLKMSPRWYDGIPCKEDFKEQDTVIVMLRLEDLTRKDGLLITDNTRVYAVVGN